MTTPTAPSQPPADWLACADDCARRDPTKAMIGAFGFGFILNVLPLRAIAALFVTLCFAFVRPVLLFLGFLKIVDLYRSTQTIPHHE